MWNGLVTLRDGGSFLVKMSLLLNCILSITFPSLEVSYKKAWREVGVFCIVWQEAKLGWGCGYWVRQHAKIFNPGLLDAEQT